MKCVECVAEPHWSDRDFIGLAGLEGLILAPTTATPGPRFHHVDHR